MEGQECDSPKDIDAQGCGSATTATCPFGPLPVILRKVGKTNTAVGPPRGDPAKPAGVGGGGPLLR